MPHDPYWNERDIADAVAGRIKVNLRPTPAQQRWLDLGCGLMVHFGINTFHDCEWSDGHLDPATFNPVAFDANQWAAAAKAAGIGYLVLTAKHHDGFCLWHTRWTAYHCGNTPFKRDVIEEVADACRRHGIRLGFYYSLWDRHEPSYPHDRGYALFMKRQLSELLTRYGDIVELWFDGGWQKGGVHYQDNERWHWTALYEHIKSIQPDCLVGNNGTSGRSGEVVMWPCDFRIGEKRMPGEKDRTVWYCGGIGDWLPYEAAYTLSEGGDKKGAFASGKWFWHATDVTAHTPEWVMERLAEAQARQTNLLLNAGPSDRGLLRDVDVACLQAVGRLRRERQLAANPPPPAPGTPAVGAEGAIDA